MEVCVCLQKICSRMSILLLMAVVIRCSDKKLCDIRVWYLNIITDDIFNAELTREQLQLKQSIENLVLNSASSTEARMTDCYVLQMYDDMLKEHFNYNPSDRRVTLHEVVSKTEQTIGENDDTSGALKPTNTQSDDSGDNTKHMNGATYDGKDIFESSTDDAGDEFDQVISETMDDSAKNEAIEKTDDKKATDEKSSINVETMVNYDSLAKHVEGVPQSDRIDSSESYLELQVSEGNKKDSEEMVDTANVKDSIRKGINSDHSEDDTLTSFKDNIEEDTQKDDEIDETDIDETEVLEDDDDTDEFDDEMQEKDNQYEPFKTNIHEIKGDVHDFKEPVLGRYSKSGQEDFHKTKLRGYDNEGKPVFKEVQEAVSPSHLSSSQQGSICGLGSFCSSKCYYIFSASYCILGYEIQSKHTLHERTESVSKGNNDLNSNDDVEQLDTDGVEQLCSGKLSDGNNEGVTKVMKEDSGEKQTLDDTLHDDILSDELIDEFKELTADASSSHKEPDNPMFESTEVQKNFPKEKTSTSIKKDDEELVDTSREQSHSIHKFESLIQQKTLEYSNKIQTLELMIMKLENQLLTESLNKQNHSSTITRLENLILKFENDLLKMNKNYNTLQSQTEDILSKQKHYSEIEQKNQLQLPDKTSSNSELISQQQSKIQELFEILKNQSTFVAKMKDRYDKLEEQNMMLHQMVMNQTIFMTSIIKTVQDLTDQNTKTKQEMQKIKDDILAAKHEKENKKSVSNIDISILEANIIDKLDSMLYDNVDKTQKTDEEDLEEDGDKEDTDDASKNLQHYLKQLPLSEMVINWCPKENFTCPACFHNSVIHSKCVPFPSVSWAYCTVPATDDDASPKADEEDNNIPMNADNSNDQHEAPNMDESTHSVKTVERADEDKNKSYKDTTQNEDEHENDKGSIELKHSEETASDKGKYEIKKKYNKDGMIKGYTSDGKLVVKHYENTISEKTDSSSDTTSKHKNNQVNENTDTTNEQLQKVEKKTDKNEDSADKKEDKSDGENPIKDIRDNTENKIADSTHEQLQKDDKSASQPQTENTSTKKYQISNDDAQPNEDLKFAGEQLSLENNAKTEDSADKNEGKKVGDKPKEDIPENTKDSNIQQKEVEKAADNKLPVQSGERGTNNTSKQKMLMKVPLHLDSDTQKEPKDCYDYYVRGSRRDGLFKVKPVGMKKMVDVFCDMKRGGWTVIQRRQDGSSSFFLNWADYKKGFGGLYGEHWLGNDNLFYITNQDYYSLRVDLMDWDRNKKYAEFSNFLVENEDEGYRLHVGGYSGDAGDGMSKHNGHKFSTKDVDNDKVVKEFGGSCANRFSGAGWYYKCYASNLNGKYYKGGKIPEKLYDGVTWKPWTGPNYSLKKVEMKIRPASVK